MRLLITGKLADRSIYNHIYPITLLKEVEEILIVRDTKGVKMDKCTYYCPPKWSLKFPPLSFILKFFIMTYFAIIKKPALVHGYLLFPHALMAFIVGKLTCRNVGISLIAGPIELYSGGSPVKNYSYCDKLPNLNLRAKLFKKVIDNSNVVTVTGTYTEKFLEDIGVIKNKIVILPHTVDENFTNNNINKIYDIVMIGRLAKVKNAETLLKALELVKKNLPDVKVAIVGDGECKLELETISKKLNLTNVHFLGYQKNVWEYYNNSKISILTSEREGFPYSVVESLKCGVPVITSNCGDVNDLIKDKYNGLIVEKYEDYISFSEKIINLLSDEKKLEEYSKNSSESVKDINPKKVSRIWRNDIFKLFSN